MPKTHGLSYKHSLYSTWKTMRTRCNNPNSISWKNYGGRGIEVCKRWDDFTVFISDMGDKPSNKHTLDRINNDGNYEPDNCRWATWSEQMKTQRRKSQSGIKGVYWYPRIKRWVARADIDCGKKHLGTYKTRNEAIAAVRRSKNVSSSDTNRGQRISLSEYGLPLQPQLNRGR